jgi:hypothetical protein
LSHHFRHATFGIGAVFVKFALVAFDVFDHQVLARELDVVGEMVDELIVT